MHALDKYLKLLISIIKCIFQPPVPKRPWDGILNVTEKGASCIQGSNSVEGSEDCLIVKIYTPEVGLIWYAREKYYK